MPWVTNCNAMFQYLPTTSHSSPKVPIFPYLWLYLSCIFLPRAPVLGGGDLHQNIPHPQLRVQRALLLPHLRPDAAHRSDVSGYRGHALHVPGNVIISVWKCPNVSIGVSRTSTLATSVCWLTSSDSRDWSCGAATTTLTTWRLCWQTSVLDYFR